MKTETLEAIGAAGNKATILGGSVSVPTQIGTATDWNGAVVGIYASMAYKSVEVTA